ncbi:carboxyltransferase subunit alpha [Butyrivibrio sp. INlla14]|uniref:carboxyltransferase subunit alpha n=1 Tax=Butyrivibrio sp. INlla14 TaxID=1520808 RepID=UPI0008766D85|nr:carboxyltransferase subunit alpha [Butyrivibrio sp. INlla14]SCY31624.1 acetyl-CoA carboxylase carboxyl transferase subunit alpha [Butyrivibrio sp. INlla14]
MTDIEIVRNARGIGRRTSIDYIEGIFTDFMELSGDRLFGDDKAVIGGIAFLKDIPVTVIGIEKGKDTGGRIKHNFGSARPEGYRKALRLMKQAEKFKRPVICFVDTAGAYCDVESEEHGQGRAIAENLYEMSDLKTPILSIVIGEGGSGGALALSHGDKIWMIDDAYFSVVSPESCSNILWKTTDKADVAARALGLTAQKLYSLGIIDKIIKNSDPEYLLDEIYKEIVGLSKKSSKELLDLRYEKFRTIGY